MFILFLYPQLWYKGEKHELTSRLEQCLPNAAKSFLFSPLTTFISLTHRPMTCKNLQLFSCLRRLLAQEPVGLFDRAINQLRRGKGTKPGSPVMSKMTLCQKLRQQVLTGCPNMFQEVVARKYRTWNVFTLMQTTWGKNKRSLRLWPSPRDLTSVVKMKHGGMMTCDWSALMNGYILSRRLGRGEERERWHCD